MHKHMLNSVHLGDLEDFVHSSQTMGQVLKK